MITGRSTHIRSMHGQLAEAYLVPCSLLACQQLEKVEKHKVCITCVALGVALCRSGSNCSWLCIVSSMRALTAHHHVLQHAYRACVRPINQCSLPQPNAAAPLTPLPFVSFHQASGPPPPACASLLPQLAALVLQASSWFQPSHFAAAAAAMCSCGMEDPEFWDNFTAAADHKVGAFSFQQLAQVLAVLATVG